ncbi:putative reverse transcriptase domain-containing protein [Tanacetum coccineum]
MTPKKRTTRLNPETTTITPATTFVTNAQLKAMIDQGVTAALAARDANANGVDNHNSGTGDRRNERANRECTYLYLMKCQPINFKGTEGVFSTCTLLGNALTSWNSHVRTVGNDVAYVMNWTKLKKKMTDKDILRRNVQNLRTTTIEATQREMSMLQRKCMRADRSFVSTAFCSQIDITPTALNHYYNTKLVDKRIIGLNTILRGCTLKILNHPFNIDLMPVELGSFDAIIGMDWLVKYQAIIVCAEKIVRIP